VSEIVLGFTGTRRPGTRIQRDTLKELLFEARAHGAEWMHNGDCVGLDAFAGTYWRAIGGKLHLHPPSDPRLRAYLDADIVEMPKAYLVRNRDIVNDSTRLIAAPNEMTEQDRGGTWSTIRYAILRKSPLMIVRPDGSATPHINPPESVA
jgi:hypothetical protein